MPSLKLYHLPIEEHFGANPRKVLILLNELNLEWEGVPIPRQNVRTDSSFNTLHPNRKVPILEDGPIRIIESTAILEYLVETYDVQNQFLSTDPQSKFDAIAWISLQTTGLGLSMWNYATIDDPVIKSRFRNEVINYFQLLDNKLSTSTSGYILDSGYSIADIAWISFTDNRRLNLLKLEDWSQFPHVDAWQKLVNARPALQKSYGITSAITTFEPVTSVQN